MGRNCHIWMTGKVKRTPEKMEEMRLKIEAYKKDFKEFSDEVEEFDAKTKEVKYRKNIDESKNVSCEFWKITKDYRDFCLEMYKDESFAFLNAFGEHFGKSYIPTYIYNLSLDDMESISKKIKDDRRKEFGAYSKYFKEYLSKVKKLLSDEYPGHFDIRFHVEYK